MSVADYAIVSGSNQSCIDSEGDSMVIAATEDHIAEQVPPRRHVNGSRRGGAAGGRPCIQKSLGGVCKAVAFGTQIHHIVSSSSSSSMIRQ